MIEDLIPGETYYVQIDGWLEQDGDFLIRVFEGLVGIDEQALSAFRLFPNPTESMLNISSSELTGLYQMEILDINGRTVQRETLNLSPDRLVSLDLSSLPSGIYSVRLSSEESVHTARLILE